MQDQVWGRVTANRDAGKTTRYYMDEFHLLLREEQTAAYSVEIWKRFRKWGGIPTGITQNVKDLLSSREVENIFENSDFLYMLNQASGDRAILAKQRRRAAFLWQCHPSFRGSLPDGSGALQDHDYEMDRQLRPEGWVIWEV